MSQSVFFVVMPKNGDFDDLFSRSYFTRLSNRFAAVGLFYCRFSTTVSKHCGEKKRDFRKFSKKFGCFQNVFNPGCRFPTRTAGIFAFCEEKIEILQFVNKLMQIDGREKNFLPRLGQISRQFSVCFQVFHFLPIEIKILPVIVVYPILSKYIVSGIALGSVKG